VLNLKRQLTIEIFQFLISIIVAHTSQLTERAGPLV